MKIIGFWPFNTIKTILKDEFPNCVCTHLRQRIFFELYRISINMEFSNGINNTGSQLLFFALSST